MDIQLQYKELIWLFAAVPVIILLFVAILKWKKKVRKRIGDEKLVKTLMPGYSSKLFAVKFIFLSVAFALGVVAVLNPGKLGASDNITRKGIDMVIALDVSKSMLATDVQPSRLEKAKDFIRKLMQEMPDDRIGLVIFAGKAYMQMPLTVDHNAADLFISSATPGSILQQGTVISDALTMSANVFNNKEKRFKAVLLISDGEGHDENAIESAKEISQRGIMINTIGIGSPEGSEIFDPATGESKKDASGNVVITKLNEDLLRQIAQNTNGAYIRLQKTEESVNEMTGHLSQIEKKAFADMSMAGFHSYYLFFAAAMFLFLVSEFFVPEKRKRRS